MDNTDWALPPPPPLSRQNVPYFYISQLSLKCHWSIFMNVHEQTNWKFISKHIQTLSCLELNIMYMIWTWGKGSVGGGVGWGCIMNYCRVSLPQNFATKLENTFRFQFISTSRSALSNHEHLQWFSRINSFFRFIPGTKIRNCFFIKRSVTNKLYLHWKKNTTNTCQAPVNC